MSMRHPTRATTYLTRRHRLQPYIHTPRSPERRVSRGCRALSRQISVTESSGVCVRFQVSHLTRTNRSRCDLAPNSSCMHSRDCASSKDHAGLCVRLYEKLSPLLTPPVDLLWSLPAPSLQIDRQERKPDSLASETIRSKRQSAMDVKCHQNRRF